MLLFELQQLNEANVLNITQSFGRMQSIKSLLEPLIRSLERVGPAVHKTIEKKLIQIFVNDPSCHKPVTELPNGAPDWAIASMERGDLVACDIYQSADVVRTLQLVCSSVRQAEQKGDKSFLTGFVHLKTIDDLTKYIDHHIQEQGRIASKGAQNGELHIVDLGEYIAVELTTQEACERNGKVLQNCIEEMTPIHHQEGNQIIVIKTKSGNAVVGIELVHSEIHQVRGKQNAPPTQKYVPAIIQTLNHMKAKASGYEDPRKYNIEDLETVDDVTAAGIMYDHETGEFTPHPDGDMYADYAGDVD